MRCPNCGSERCQLVTETNTYGKDYSAGKGCLGWLMFGPIGALCGACGKGKQTVTTTYWICHDCGYKFKA